MSQTKKSETSQYTCNDYREEMILLGLQRRLKNPDLTDEEKKAIQAEIKKIEKLMDMEWYSPFLSEPEVTGKNNVKFFIPWKGKLLLQSYQNVNISI